MQSSFPILVSRWSLPIALPFWALGAQAAEPSVVITSPAPASAVWAPVQVSATATPADSVAFSSVTAQVGPDSYSLSSSDGLHWTGTLALTGEGARTLVVTAVDKIARSASQQLAFTLVSAPPSPPPAPQPTIVAELDGVPLGGARYALKTSARLHAECLPKGNACASLSAAFAGGAQLAHALDSIDTVIDFSEVQSGQLKLVVSAANADGVSSTVAEQLSLAPGASITEVFSSAAYRIEDFDATRVLVGGAAPTLYIYERSTQTFENTHATTNAGYLFSRGAVWAGGMMRDGETIADSSLDGFASGDYVYTTTGVRNIATDASSECQLPPQLLGRALGPNGLLVAKAGDATFPTVYICNQGSTIQTRPGRVESIYTDGVNILYFDRISPDGMHVLHTMSLAGTSGELVVYPGQFFMANGWVAYVNNKPQPVVYTRSPGSETKQASIFTDATDLYGLRPNGEVALAHAGMWIASAAGENARRFPAPPALSSVMGKEDGWYVKTEHFLYKLDTSAGGASGGSGGGQGGTGTGGNVGVGGLTSSGSGGTLGSGGGAAASGGSPAGGAFAAGGAAVSGGAGEAPVEETAGSGGVDAGSAGSLGVETGGDGNASGAAGEVARGGTVSESRGGASTAGRGDTSSGGSPASAPGSQGGVSNEQMGSGGANCNCTVVGVNSNDGHGPSVGWLAAALLAVRMRSRRRQQLDSQS